MTFRVNNLGFVYQNSDKEFIVTGANTFTFRHQLSGLGLTWNGDTRHWSTDDESKAKQAALMIGGKWERTAPPTIAVAQGGGGETHLQSPLSTPRNPQNADIETKNPAQDAPGEGSEARDMGRDSDASDQADDEETDEAPISEQGSDDQPDEDEAQNTRGEPGPTRDVDTLTHREANQVLSRLNKERNIRIGDVNRGPMSQLPMKQAKIMACLPDKKERCGFIADTVGSEKPTRKGGQASPQQGSQNNDDSLEDEFSKKQARAIREAIESNQSESLLDEDRVREIAREEDADEPNLNRMRQTALETVEHAATIILDKARTEAKQLDQTVIDAVVGQLSEFNDKAQTHIQDTFKRYGALMDSQVEERIQELIQPLQAGGGGERKITLEVKMPDAQPITSDISTTHYLSTLVCALVAQGQPVLLVGPPGSGKSHLAEDIARMQGRKFGGALSVFAEITASQLVGKNIPNLMTGKQEYYPAPFINAVENGYNYHLDELDASDPNTTLSLNSVLANGYVYVEARAMAGLDPRVNRHTTNGITGGANTFMTGANSQMAGRQTQDAAFVDRWFVVPFGYDENVVARMIGAQPDPAKCRAHWQPTTTPFTQNERDAWFGWWAAMGEYVAQKFKTTRTWSPRVLQRIVAARTVGISPKDTLGYMLAGWKTDDIKNLGALAEVPEFTPG